MKRNERDFESEYRVIEMLHAIKFFIEAANRLTQEDIDTLGKVADFMKKSKTQEPCEMTISEIEKALGHPIKIIKEHSNEEM